jgi:hypothetical protein
VPVGSDVAAAVSYSTAAGGTAAFGVVANGTTVINSTESRLAGDYDSSTAEFINERPNTCNPDECFPTLTNYSVTWWSAARVWTPAGVVAAANSSPFALVLTSDGSTQAPPCASSSTILAYPESLSGETFDSVWCRAF